MSEHIESVLQENRRFAPAKEFRERAHLSSLEEYERLYRQSLEDPETFWANVASELHWFEPWKSVREWNEPFVRWFDGGTTNIAYNALDRHVEAGRGDKVAYHWEGEPGDRREITYRER